MTEMDKSSISDEKTTGGHLFSLLIRYIVCWVSEVSCGRNLDDLIVSLGATGPSETEASLLEKQSSVGGAEATVQYPKCLEEPQDEAATQGEEMKELIPEESDGEAEEEGNEEEDDKEEEEEESEDSELMPSLEESYETNIEEVGAEQLTSGLRRRIRPE